MQQYHIYIFFVNPKAQKLEFQLVNNAQYLNNKEIIVLIISMKEPLEDTQDIGLQEQNYLFKAIKDLKDSIFNVLYVLLDKDEDQEQDQPMFGLIFESGLDYFQMLAFPFDESIMDSWNGGETLNNISKVFSKLNIMSYLPGVGFNTFLAMLYGLIFLIILVLIDIIYVSYSFSKKRFRFTWPLVILAKLVPLFVTIFFLPITQTLLSVVRCGSQNQSDEQVMLSFPDVVCWKGLHLFHASITLLFTSLFVFISSIVALALFEPRMVSKKLTARQNSTGQVIFIMNKIICQLIFSFNPFKDKLVYSLMLFGLSGWLYWTYNMKDPFYNKKASKFFRIVSSYYFWTNTMLLVSQLLGPLGFNGGLVIWISGLPFIGIIIGFQHKSNIDQLFSFNLKFKSGQQLQGHLRYVLQLLQSQDEDKNSYMLVTGYIQKHKQICIEDDCPLKGVKKLNKLLSEKEDLNQKFLLQIQRMYKLGIKKYPNCTRLRLSYAFFQLQWLKNKNKAYEQFSYALKTDPSFEEEFIIYRFKKIIRQNLQGSEGQQNKTDLIEIIRFENHISLCEQAMISSARLHKDFWTQMKQQGPDLKKLSTIGNKITKTVNVVKENYEQISKINSSVPEVLYCFSIFLIMVVKDTMQGKRLMEMSKKIYLQKVNVSKKKSNSGQLGANIDESTDQPIITVSCKAGSIGKVVNLNSLFTELCGYQRQQIVERSFQKILPQLFKDIHEQRMKQWIQSQQQSTSYVGTNRQGYIKTKSGFILPVEYEVIYKSSTQTFIVVFKNSSAYRNYCHLIVDLNLIIRDTSTLGHVYFGLDRWVLTQNQLTIKDVFKIDNFYDLVEQNKNSNFECQLMYKQKMTTCTMSIQQVSMNFKEKLNTPPQDEKSEQFQTNRLLGYYVRIFMKQTDSLDQKLQLKALQNNERDQSEDELCSNDDIDILELYEDPNLYNILIANLADAKTKTTQIQKFKLTYKIKTMRLLNNQIKMVYDQNNNYDFDNVDRDENEDDDLQLLKLNDDRYQEKIRSAINTKLNHFQVKKLNLVGLLAVVCLAVVAVGQMVLGLKLFEEFVGRAYRFQELVDQTNELCKFITATIDDTTNYTQMSEKISHHNIGLTFQQQVTIQINQNWTQTVTLKDSYLFFYSKMAQYFRVYGKINIDNIYSNFFVNIFPLIQNVKFNENSNQAVMKILMFICLLAAVVLSLSFLFMWIHTRVQIDKKKTDILLWFLDIPISYASYLGDNCDNYLKNFISVKEVMNKGIKVEECEELEDYKDLKGKQEQMQEQQKARKTLILKQRKLTFWSRLNCSYFKLTWVIVFGLAYSIIVLLQSFSLQNYENFLKDQWVFSGKTVLWINTIQMSHFLHDQGRNNINGVNVQEYHDKANNNFVSSMTQTSLNSFNSQILLKSSLPEYEQIVSSYTGLYFENICNFLQKQQDTECFTLSTSTLKSGLRIYTSHLSNHGQIDIEYIKQTRKTNQKYVSVAILKMLNIWKENMKVQVDKSINIVSIMFYIYAFAGVLFFIIGWLIYLSKLNNQINEAIKMLNMIPFKLLSSSRKETRSFIAWIIRQANKKKHQIQ